MFSLLSEQITCKSFIEQIKMNSGHDWLRNQNESVRYTQTRFLPSFIFRKTWKCWQPSSHVSRGAWRGVTVMKTFLNFTLVISTPVRPWHIRIKFLSPAKHPLTGKISMTSIIKQCKFLSMYFWHLLLFVPSCSRMFQRYHFTQILIGHCFLSALQDSPSVLLNIKEKLHNLTSEI